MGMGCRSPCLDGAQGSFSRFPANGRVPTLTVTLLPSVSPFRPVHGHTSKKNWTKRLFLGDFQGLKSMSLEGWLSENLPIFHRSLPLSLATQKAR